MVDEIERDILVVINVAEKAEKGATVFASINTKSQIQSYVEV